MAETENTRTTPRFVYLLSVAHRRVQAAIQADGSGATAARAGLLMAIPSEGATMGAIGRRLDLGAPALSGLVDRSIRAGLVERHPDPGDGRAWRLTLTEAGRKARPHAVEAAKRLNLQLSDGFDENELAVVARWLETVGERFPQR